MITPQSEKAFTALSLLQVVRKWRRLLFFVALLSIVVSTIGAFMLKDKYRSSAIIYPSRYGSSSVILLNTWTERDFYQFGEEEDAERAMQLLLSDSLREHVFHKFNLLKHYGIDPNDEHARLKLLKQFDGSISVKRTDLLSVRIDVLDEDAKMAADIANEMASYADTIKSAVLRTAGKKAFAAVSQVYFTKLKAVKTLQDSLNKMGSKNSNTPDYLSLSEMLKYSMKDLNDLETSYIKSKADMDIPLSGIFIVSWAKPAVEKYLPFRSLIILMTFLASTLLTLVSLIVYENFQSSKNESNGGIRS